MPSSPQSVTPTFHGLLYVEAGERHANLTSGTDPLDIYCGCAAACARSMAAHGAAFRLITNDAALLRDRFAALGVPAPAMVEHRFTLEVPSIPFRSAHRKLELFRAFGEGRFGPAPALIDIDTWLLRPFPLTAFTPGTLYGYDITDQVAPAYGVETIARDLQAITQDPAVSARWWGGEFIAGDPDAFAALADAVDRCWPTYLRLVGSLHHLGDEAVTSAALALLLRQQQQRVVDVGGDVVRWWSNRTIARPAISLRDAIAASLLHVPADKPMLARFADEAHDPAHFARAYRRHVLRRWPAHRLLALTAQLRGHPRHHAPRLT